MEGVSNESRHIYADADALAKAAADELFRLAQRSVAEQGIFTLSLAGGSTPRKLYTLLATEPAYRDFPWAQTHLFFGDERHVPPSHLDSNYLMVSTTLLSTGPRARSQRPPRPRGVARCEHDRRRLRHRDADFFQSHVAVQQLSALRRHPARHGTGRTHGIALSRFQGAR